MTFLAGAGMRKSKQKGAVVIGETLAALPYQHSALANKDLYSFSEGLWVSGQCKAAPDEPNLQLLSCLLANSARGISGEMRWWHLSSGLSTPPCWGLLQFCRVQSVLRPSPLDSCIFRSFIMNWLVHPTVTLIIFFLCTNISMNEQSSRKWTH